MPYFHSVFLQKFMSDISTKAINQQHELEKPLKLQSSLVRKVLRIESKFLVGNLTLRFLDINWELNGVWNPSRVDWLNSIIEVITGT